MAEIKEALATLKAAMEADPGYAWGWFCNISVPIMDATRISPKLADEAACYLMYHLFDYDVTAHPHYEGGKSGAQQYHEMRVAAERAEDAEIAARTAP